MSFAESRQTRPLLARLMPVAVLAATLSLGACAGFGAFDELNEAVPQGSPFTQALFKDYKYLAKSYGVDSSTGGTSFDVEGSALSLADVSDDVADVANAFAEKALTSAKGETVLPEAAPDDNADKKRNDLLRALDQGRDKTPELAARAQANYDCWILNGRVPALRAASQQCLRGFNAAMNAMHPPAPPPSAAPADYTVYFDFDSWTITAEGLAVLQQAIDTARSGGQSRITIVGHTDTSGSPAYNQRLSLKRANVVKDVLVQLGARPEAIQVSGVGESDLAVQTGPGVREPKNRRTVVTLLP